MNKTLMLLSLCTIMLLNSTAYAQTQAPIYQNSYHSTNDYRRAILDGAFSKAWRMLQEDFAEFLSDPEQIQKLVDRISARISEELDEVLNNTETTDLEKQYAIYDLIDYSITPEKSPITGKLWVYGAYSFDYSTLRLTWKRQYKAISCHSLNSNFGCSQTSDGSYNCSTTVNYQSDYYMVETDYSIYRIVDGQETFLTTLLGTYQLVNSNNYVPNWSAIPKYWVDRKYAVPIGVDIIAAEFYDLETDFRPIGSTLSYRIEANQNSRFTTNCGDLDNSDTTISIDADADGYPDFIENPESYLPQRELAWLPAVLHILLF